ncbi:MAG: Jag N-terminal domain-containing protein, partial [Clostridia bacterium]|nr:Jag N-terminal domain-containing protein [Clostridia bacterium]
MRSMEFSGRNVDEAIFHGLVEMGLSIDQVTTEIIQKESKGLFGLGAKNAIVRITELEVPVTPVFEKVAKSDERPKKTERQKEDRKPGRSSERSERSGKEDRSKKPTAPKIEYDDELAKTNEAALFLSDLLKAMKIDATVQAAQLEDGLRLNIVSDTDGLLIGRRGETLDAIQYLVSLYWNKDRKENAYRRVSVDTED